METVKTGAQRVQRRRDKLRAAGLRPVQTKATGFAEECARQARLVRDSEQNDSQTEEEAWAEASDTAGWTA